MSAPSLPPYTQVVSRPVDELVRQFYAMLADSQDKTDGLRHLLEAKQCFERAAIKTVELKK